MAKLTMGLSLLLGFLLTEVAQAVGVKRTYIVQMNSAGTSNTNHLSRRQAVSLEAVSADPTTDMLYSYSNVMDGYAATLTEQQAAALAAMPEVLSVKQDSISYLHTTHTPKFLGIEEAALLQQRGANGISPVDYLAARDNHGRTSSADESSIIIGVLDTGAWPESASYSDMGMPPVPAAWKGACEESEDWKASSCNKKLIGARAFYKGLEAGYAASNETYDWSKESRSPRDVDGHGTHTSTTVAGAEVPGASLYGLASGTAKGMAVGARLAIYKVCYADVGCFSADILAGMDAAVADGVNIISMSLGGPPRIGGGGDIDAISTGGFGAISRGVLVSASAGNSGPELGSVSNNAPWVMTIAASSLDRSFPGAVELGSGTSYSGQSLCTNTSTPDVDPIAIQSLTPLVLGERIGMAGMSDATNASVCLADSLDPAKAAGKVVVCMRGVNGRTEKGQVVKDAGGVGMVLINDAPNGESLIADAHVLPTVLLGNSAAAPILEYVASTAGASARFKFEGSVLGVPAPSMAGFSSRGPNIPAPDVLKPDITGPGVNVLAAWNSMSPSGLVNDTRQVAFNIISGTSMSCPHLSGVAAWIMARRPGWTPAQIKSALMTTAYQTLKGTDSPITDQADGEAAQVFDYGNGHVNPVAALDPGLVYDIQPTGYLEFLCAMNYTNEQIRSFSRDDFSCDPAKKYSRYDLNYPSFAVWYDTNTTTGDKTVTFNRNVTNVGEASTYNVSVTMGNSSLVSVTVDPKTLTFGATGESKTYTVTVKLAEQRLPSPDSGAVSQAKLSWTDGTHIVTSSMGFFWGAPSGVGYAPDPPSNSSMRAL
ncbi:unnamed protein product [Discula destructiva]